MKYSLLFSIFFYIGNLNAQNFVSTNVENKNIVLEEFTGIDCSYCPSGHQIANNLLMANPNDMVLINIHEGSYAKPDFAGDPDFRTVFGNALDSQAGVTGYPMGTVNRHVFSGTNTATSRSEWATNATTILTQTSPVNVAAQATLDMQTRELVVVTETYFTSAGGSAPYKLNIALLQDSIEAPQAGGTTWNPTQVLPNGNYLHMHMLRHMITGQWGVDITSTASGYFQADTFVYTIPIVYGKPFSISPLVEVDLSNIELVVFVSEGQQEILTGNIAALTKSPEITPTSPISIDASISANSSVNGYCYDGITPNLTVTNNGSNTITSFAINYGLFAETMITHVVSSPLPASQSTVVSLPNLNIPTAEPKCIYYELDFVNYTPNAVNTNAGDDYAVEGLFSTFGSAIPTAIFMTEDFQGYGFGVREPDGTIAYNPNDIRAYTATSDIHSSVTWNLGGFGNSDGCFRWDFYAIDSALSSTLMFDKINLTNASNSLLTFSHAHALKSSENDRLKIYASNDCGNTWTTLWDKAGVNLSTAPPTVSRFYPNVNHWVADSVDLSDFDGQSEVIIKLEGISAHGNSLYLDDFITYHDDVSNISDKKKDDFTVKIVPNPVVNSMYIEFYLNQAENLDIYIMNSLGQIVKTVSSKEFQGENSICVNTNKLSSGIYFLNISSAKEVISKRFVVNK